MIGQSVDSVLRQLDEALREGSAEAQRKRALDPRTDEQIAADRKAEAARDVQRLVEAGHGS